MHSKDFSGSKRNIAEKKEKNLFFSHFLEIFGVAKLTNTLRIILLSNQRHAAAALSVVAKKDINR
ncbi:hypothetical protein [Sphingobacterium bambusae]|uniref:Uncharacterized protein n=1 Tax=Sphingobacterium bambusae TaxID=662858 RepID=A0ABW6BRG0_9SPHI|nr:hypothetical protein [Sphingobacterium bambusae]WPL48200.1 hypothetical protein SCB77_19790 [Sphingobacterium bambusae]